jgi:ribosomal protein S1
VVVAKQNRKSAAGFVHTVAPGQIIKGVVKRFESFGAFVEVHPGVEGLLHVSNISRSRVERPEDKLTLGQELELAVLDVKDRGRRIGLGLKQLEPDPWDDINSRYDVNAVLEGRVQRITKFGVFVELEPGLEGLIHVSQMSAGRGGRMEDMVKVGSNTAVRVLSIDENEQRVALSRLDESGRVIGDDGSEPVADPSPAKRSERREPAPKVLRSDDPAAGGGGTNLGDLLRRALDDD